MTKAVVHVTTLEEWKSMLDVWFKQGYAWRGGSKDYQVRIFENGGKYLFLDDCITWNGSDSSPSLVDVLEYSEFVSQQKEGNKVETYYVTQEQLDLIDELKESDFPVYKFYGSNKYQPLAVANKLSSKEEKMLLRYLGGDTSIEFKVKETLYRLWRIDAGADKVYMSFNSLGTPSSSIHESDAFTAPLEEIKKHKTILWEIEEVGE